MKTIRDYITIVENSLDERVTIPPDGNTQIMPIPQPAPAGFKPPPPGVIWSEPDDLGNGFTLTSVDIQGEKIPAVMDTESKMMILRNRRASGGAIIKNNAPYIGMQDGIMRPMSTVGPDTKAALKAAGIE